MKAIPVLLALAAVACVILLFGAINALGRIHARLENILHLLARISDRQEKGASEDIGQTDWP